MEYLDKKFGNIADQEIDKKIMRLEIIILIKILKKKVIMIKIINYLKNKLLIKKI
jgi:hypothetical protein